MVSWLDFLLPRRDRIEAPEMAPAEPFRAPRRSQPAVSNLPGFRASATEQLGGRASRSEQARLKLRTAFTPSQPVSDPAMLAGRGELLQTLIRAIEEQRLHVVLFGDRGTGKTSLLHILAKLAHEARYIVHYAPCDEGSNFSDVFRAAAADVPLLYHADYDPGAAETESGQTLASLIGDGPLAPRRLSDMLAKVTGTRLLIVLDEFDRSAPGEFRRQVAELIKNLSDRSTRVQLVIAGVAANLTELIEHIPSIRRNIVGLPVPSMTADEVQELLANGERASGFPFDPAAVAMIVQLAAGSPYLAGLLGQHAGLLAVERGGESVGAQDVTGAIGRAADEIADRVSERSRYAVDRAARDGDGLALPKLAHAALRQGGRFGEEALAELFPDRAERQRQLERLAAAHGLIEAIADDPAERYRFREEGVPTYLWIRHARDDIGVPAGTGEAAAIRR